jgi:hypothetical protein
MQKEKVNNVTFFTRCDMSPSPSQNYCGDKIADAIKFITDQNEKD